MSEQIDKSTQEWLKEIMVAESPYAELKKRITELERQVQDYKEENVKLLQQCLALYRALMKQRDEAEKVMQTCAHNVWFCQIKERTY